MTTEPTGPRWALADVCHAVIDAAMQPLATVRDIEMMRADLVVLDALLADVHVERMTSATARVVQAERGAIPGATATAAAAAARAAYRAVCDSQGRPDVLGTVHPISPDMADALADVSEVVQPDPMQPCWKAGR